MFPSDLSDSGRDLYESLMDGREVSAAHRILIHNAARIADRLDELHVAVGGRLTVTNSQSTETINPLISEARMLSTSLAQVLAKLGVGELPRVRSGEVSIRDALAERRARREAAAG